MNIHLNRLIYQFNKLSKTNLETRLQSTLEVLINEELSSQDFNSWMNINNLDFLKDYTWIYRTNYSYTIDKNIHYFIFENKISSGDPFFDNYKIISSSLLQSNINSDKEIVIPKLFFIKAELLTNSTLINLDKYLANYGFLAEALEALLHLNFKSEYIRDDFKIFIDKNKSKIDTILNLSTHNPKFLGSGVDGIAFSIANNFILKIFTNQALYNKSLDAWHRLHNQPKLAKTEAMIYDVGKIGSFNEKEIYYYIIEKMIPVSDLGIETNLPLYEIISEIVNLINDNKEMLIEIKNNKSLKPIVIKNKLNKFQKVFTQEVYNTKSEQINEVENIIDLNQNWVENLVEEILVKYVTDRLDLHLGNLGVTKYKQLRYFDPYYEGADKLENPEINIGKFN